MGSMFRSEEMSLCQLFIAPEAAYASVAELGERSCFHFRDLNSAESLQQRRFVSEVRRCEQLQSRLDFIAQEISQTKIKLQPLADADAVEPAAPQPREINEIENDVERIEQELRELKQNGDALHTNFTYLNEQQLLLEHADANFAADMPNVSQEQSSASVTTHTNPKYLDYVTGVIKLERFFAFERMLWRIGHGNIFIKRQDLNVSQLSDPLMREASSSPQTLFIAYFQGERLQQLVHKVCNGFHARLYACSAVASERAEMLAELRLQLADMQLVISQTIDRRQMLLVQAASKLNYWTVLSRKMQAIYHILNKFDQDVSNKCLVGEGWTPTSELPALQASLQQVVAAGHMQTIVHVVETEDVPPTFNRTNMFTRGFQSLTDAYGMACYREVNPSLYSCITFPFLFAVMFGDIGHGLMLLLVALWLVLKERKLAHIKEEVFQLFFSGRYIILLMGIFSMYTGLIYNETLSRSLNIFGSGWRINYNTSTVVDNDGLAYLTLDPSYSKTHTYAMGMDPVWQLAVNKIVYLNTYKMKMSIIFAIVHMSFGICMSFVNYVHLKKKLDIIFNFLPQMLFLLLLFGYMVFMMFFKAFKYTAQTQDLALTPGCAPSILILFINMMLFGHSPPEPGCKEYLFEGQDILQTVFVIIALLCIPWMLLAKPLYEMQQRKKQAASLATLQQQQSEPSRSDTYTAEEKSSADLFIYQAIHTIEYVLSTISHTASYLRLWALSLAHSQLSDVLWTQMLRLGFVLRLGYFNVVLIFLIFWIFAFLTICILVIIEGLSAFLHTLRLHWVEFNSKFYMGEGYAYEPFSFKTVLAAKEE